MQPAQLFGKNQFVQFVKKNQFFGKNRKNKRLVVALLLLIGGGLLATKMTKLALDPGRVLAQTQQAQVQQAQAQTATLNESSLTAIPPRLGEDRSLKVKPGEKAQSSVRVRNGSSETVTIKSQAQDFIVDDNGSTPIPIEGSDVSNRWSLASWVVLTPSVQELAPGEIGTVNVVIEAPGNALPGGHYAMVTHQLVGDSANAAADALKALQPEFRLDENRQSASVLQQRVGTLLYLTVDGPINEAAFIRELEIPQFSEFGPVPFSFLVDNQSDIHLSPKLGVEIYNLLGRRVETIDIETNNVFPFIARQFKGEWDRIWGFGPYTAKVVMSYGQAGQLAMATASFWLLPVTIILAALIVLLVLIAIIIVIRRHLTHRRDDDRQRVEELEAKVRELEEEKLQQFD